MDTKSYKLDSLDKSWLLVDASDKTLGRLSTNIAKILMGKNKPEYTPHNDVGDYVVVINAEKKKANAKKTSSFMLLLLSPEQVCISLSWYKLASIENKRNNPT